MSRSNARKNLTLIKILRNCQHGVTRGAEIGVLRGDASRELLKAFPRLFLHLVDTWSAADPNSSYSQSQDIAAKLHWSQHLANEQLAYSQTAFAEKRRVLLRAPSTVAAQAVANDSLDFVFIDAEHTYKAVSGDIRAWWPKVRDGGILSGHDYGGRLNRRGLWGVDRAVNEFCRQQNIPLERANHGIWWLRKQRNGGSPSATKNNGAIVRVLFGALDDRHKLRREIIAAFSNPWNREVPHYYVAGTENSHLLAQLGAQHIHLVHPDPYVGQLEKYGRWYAKPWLIREALRIHSEILFLDFDNRMLRYPDERMWQMLRAKQGPAGGSFQAANVGYRRPCMLPIYGRRKRHLLLRALNTSVVYCRDTTWLDSWLDAFNDMIANGYSPQRYNDETPLLLSIDKKLGVIEPAEMVETFEIPVHRLRRATPEARSAWLQGEGYFQHR